MTALPLLIFEARLLVEHNIVSFADVTALVPGSSNPLAKDTKRISDIVSKSKGDDTKKLKLTVTEAKLIKDAKKAVRRGRAAELHNDPTMNMGAAQVFYSRAMELMGHGHMLHPIA